MSMTGQIDLVIFDCDGVLQDLVVGERPPEVCENPAIHLDRQLLAVYETGSSDAPPRTSALRSKHTGDDRFPTTGRRPTSRGTSTHSRAS